MFNISNFSWSMLETIPFPSFEEMRPVIDDIILKASRSKEPQKDKLSKLQTLYGIKLNRSSLYKVHATITGRVGLDATTISELKQDNSILAKFGEKKFLVAMPPTLFQHTPKKSELLHCWSSIE